MNFFYGLVTAWGIFLIYDYIRKEVCRIQNSEMLDEIEISIMEELAEAYKILQKFIKLSNEVDTRTSNEKLSEHLEFVQNYSAHENNYFSQVLGMVQTVLAEYIEKIIFNNIQPDPDDQNVIIEIAYAVVFRTVVTAAFTELEKYRSE